MGGRNWLARLASQPAAAPSAPPLGVPFDPVTMIRARDGQVHAVLDVTGLPVDQVPPIVAGSDAALLRYYLQRWPGQHGAVGLLPTRLLAELGPERASTAETVGRWLRAPVRALSAAFGGAPPAAAPRRTQRHRLLVSVRGPDPAELEARVGRYHELLRRQGCDARRVRGKALRRIDASMDWTREAPVGQAPIVATVDAAAPAADSARLSAPSTRRLPGDGRALPPPGRPR
jgi:hypothetical protein